MKFSKSFNIGNIRVGESCPVYFIADIAANHDGCINRAKELIFLAAESGANAAKFQHFNADTIVSDRGFRDLGKVSHQSHWKSSVYEVYKNASLSLSWTSELKRACQEARIEFLTSPYDYGLVDEVNPYVSAFKIGSGDITWTDLISYISEKNKPLIIATGASNMRDVERAVDSIHSSNNNLCLMQCNTNYTASLENFKFINLKVLETYRKRFPGIVLGLSDHTHGSTTVLGAIAIGAKIIEKHFTDDCSREGPDHLFSMNPEAWREMVDKSRELEAALGFDIKRVEENESQTVILQRRSIRLNKTLQQGTVVSKGDLSFLRPCPEDAIQPYDADQVVGKVLKVTIEKGGHLRWEDVR